MIFILFFIGLISSYKMNKRKLSSEEIEFLLDFIKPNLKIPTETAESVVMLTKKRLKKQLVDQMIYPEVIPQLKVLLEKNYRESLIEPGTSVGILCAQSIGKFFMCIFFNKHFKLFLTFHNNIFY